MDVEEEYALVSEVAGRVAPDERYILFWRISFLFFRFCSFVRWTEKDIMEPCYDGDSGQGQKTYLTAP